MLAVYEWLVVYPRRNCLRVPASTLFARISRALFVQKADGALFLFDVPRLLPLYWQTNNEPIGLQQRCNV